MKFKTEKRCLSERQIFTSGNTNAYEIFSH
jgi:hypothetical protein